MRSSRTPSSGLGRLIESSQIPVAEEATGRGVIGVRLRPGRPYGHHDSGTTGDEDGYELIPVGQVDERCLVPCGRFDSPHDLDEVEFASQQVLSAVDLDVRPRVPQLPPHASRVGSSPLVLEGVAEEG